MEKELSFFDLQLETANRLVYEAMQDEDFKAALHEKKMDYIHNKGWSVGKTMKAEADIPHKAFWALPEEIRDHPKEVMKWIKKYHPYLLLKK